MTFEIFDCGPKLEQEDIVELERAISSPIPDDYKDFLILYNGGEPEYNAINFDGDSLGIKGANIGYFYGLGVDSEDIIKASNDLDEQLQVGFIPIADTPAGNYFIMSLKQGSFGEIYYKDHEYEDTVAFSSKDKPLPESMIFVANSFSEFISILYDSDA